MAEQLWPNQSGLWKKKMKKNKSHGQSSVFPILRDISDGQKWKTRFFSDLISNNSSRRRHFYKSLYQAKQNIIDFTIVFTRYQFHTSFSRRVAVFHDISQHFWGWFRHFHTISPLSAIFCGKWRNWATIKGYSWVLGYFRMPNKLYAFLLLTSFCCK